MLVIFEVLEMAKCVFKTDVSPSDSPLGSAAEYNLCHVIYPSLRDLVYFKFQNLAMVEWVEIEKIHISWRTGERPDGRMTVPHYPLFYFEKCGDNKHMVNTFIVIHVDTWWTFFFAPNISMCMCMRIYFDPHPVYP